MMNITIVCAGIGGLTTAIALRKYFPSANVEIFEGSEELKPVGAGIGLGANAVMAFRELDIAEAVLAESRIIEKFRILDKAGRVLTQTNNFALNKAHNIVSNFSIHRTNLQQALLNNLEGVPIHLGKRVQKFKQRDRIVLEFTDGSLHETDYIIATDGIHSVFRKQLLPGAGVRFAGYTCWRGVTHIIPSTLEGMHIASETWAEGKRFGIVPLKGSRVYWFACINSPALNNLQYRAFTRADLLKSFSDFHTPVTDLISITDPEAIIWNDIIDFKPISQYAFGNILLSGDAAHATTPNMGQGACQAIEDAVVLGKLLQKINNPQEAFLAFEKKRIPRATFIVNRSWQIGKIAQLQNPVLTKLRDAAFRLIPETTNERQIKQMIDVSFE